MDRLGKLVPAPGVYIEYDEDVDCGPSGASALVYDSVEGDTADFAKRIHDEIGKSVRVRVRVGEYDYLFIDPLTVKRVAYETRYVRKYDDEGEE